jgi:hypothetical protein
MPRQARWASSISTVSLGYGSWPCRGCCPDFYRPIPRG